MNKKTAGRISTMAMASMMMMSVCVVNASAEENEPITQLNLKKTVTTDGNTYQPNTSFSFHVENGEAAENWRDNVVYAGVTGGITASQTIGFQPSGEDTLAAAYSKNATLEINAEVFEHAGVYHYVVTEDAGSYEGIDYDTAGRDVYLFVYNGADGALYVGNVITENNGEKGDLEFINDYGAENDTTHDVTIKKTITGNQGVKNKSFEFKVAVNGGQGELYKVVVKKNANAQALTEYITSNEAETSYQISDTGSITIYGLTESDKYTVTETDANKDGYTTTIDGETTATGTKTGTTKEDGTVVQYVNEKDAAVVTGVAKKYTPYVLLVGAAGAFGSVFFRRNETTEGQEAGEQREELFFKVIEAGNKILEILAALFIILMLLYGAYSLWDTCQINRRAFISGELMKYKPAGKTDESPSLQELQKINPDVCAWLTVDGTKIDYPVVQGETNLEYINQDIYGEFALSGSIFLDSRNDRKFIDDIEYAARELHPKFIALAG